MEKEMIPFNKLSKDRVIDVDEKKKKKKKKK